MSIEIGSKWVKDGEVVEVTNTYESVGYICIWYIDDKNISHILVDYDFLKQYKHYEPVYEWQWCTKYNINDLYEATEYYTEEEIEEHIHFNRLVIQRLDFTKRERKQNNQTTTSLALCYNFTKEVKYECKHTAQRLSSKLKHVATNA